MNTSALPIITLILCPYHHEVNLQWRLVSIDVTSVKLGCATERFTATNKVVIPAPNTFLFVQSEDRGLTSMEKRYSYRRNYLCEEELDSSTLIFDCAWILSIAHTNPARQGMNVVFASMPIVGTSTLTSINDRAFVDPQRIGAAAGC